MTAGGVVILDGPDASGKTTLANYLVQHFGALYTHLSYIPGRVEMFSAQIAALEQAYEASAKGKLFVIDRHWPSDNIYAEVYRGGSTLSLQARMLDRIAMKLGAVYVLAFPGSIDTACAMHRQTAEAGREMYESDDRIRKVAELYHNLWFGGQSNAKDYVGFLTRRGGVRARGDWRLYNMFIHGKPDALQKWCYNLLEQIEYCRVTQWKPALSSSNPYILGSFSGSRVLFVGYQSVNATQAFPFVGLDLASELVSCALHELDFLEEHGMWIDIASDSGIEHLRELVSHFSWDAIVAIGDNCASRMENYGVHGFAKVVDPTAASDLGFSAFKSSLQAALAGNRTSD